MTPTEPGYYWVRWAERLVRKHGYSAEPQIVRFETKPSYWLEEIDGPAPYELRVWQTGSDVSDDVDDFEWLEGPLKPSGKEAL